MLDWLKNNAMAARDKLTTEVGKYKNKEFMEAVVSGCALVAAADGEIAVRFEASPSRRACSYGCALPSAPLTATSMTRKRAFAGFCALSLA